MIVENKIYNKTRIKKSLKIVIKTAKLLRMMNKLEKNL